MAAAAAAEGGRVGGGGSIRSAQPAACQCASVLPLVPSGSRRSSAPDSL